jgi:PadR family transcriptional regulator, regulatory protein AphA
MTVRTRSRALTTTEYAVLGLLAGGERSGYDLKRVAEAGVGYVWPASKSQIYAVLPRLVAGGYATARHVAQERRPDKQVYRITAAGERALREWLEDPVDDPDPTRSPFLLKVFFGRLVPRDALVAHIEKRRADAEASVAEYRAIEDTIRAREADYYGYVTLRWGLRHQQAWIEWADQILNELEERGA